MSYEFRIRYQADQRRNEKNEIDEIELLILKKKLSINKKITSAYSQFDIHKFARKLQKVSKIPPTFLFP